MPEGDFLFQSTRYVVMCGAAVDSGPVLRPEPSCETNGCDQRDQATRIQRRKACSRILRILSTMAEEHLQSNYFVSSSSETPGATAGENVHRNALQGTSQVYDTVDVDQVPDQANFRLISSVPLDSLDLVLQAGGILEVVEGNVISAPSQVQGQPSGQDRGQVVHVYEYCGPSREQGQDQAQVTEVSGNCVPAEDLGQLQAQELEQPQVQELERPQVQELGQPPVQGLAQVPVLELAQVPVLELAQVPVLELAHLPVLELGQLPVLELGQLPVLELRQVSVLELGQLQDQTQVAQIFAYCVPLQDQGQLQVQEQGQARVVSTSQEVEVGVNGVPSQDPGQIQVVDEGEVRDMGSSGPVEESEVQPTSPKRRRVESAEGGGNSDDVQVPAKRCVTNLYHLPLSVSKDGMYHCQHCDAVYDTFQGFHVHRTTLRQCHACGEWCGSRKQLADHQKYDERCPGSAMKRLGMSALDLEAPHVCPLCAKRRRFKTAVQLTDHARNNHGTALAVSVLHAKCNAEFCDERMANRR